MQPGLYVPARSVKTLDTHRKTPKLKRRAEVTGPRSLAKVAKIMKIKKKILLIAEGPHEIPLSSARPDVVDVIV